MHVELRIGSVYTAHARLPTTHRKHCVAIAGQVAGVVLGEKIAGGGFSASFKSGRGAIEVEVGELRLQKKAAWTELKGLLMGPFNSLLPQGCAQGMFPTSSCGVLVFDSVPRRLALRLLRRLRLHHLSHTIFVTHHLPHTHNFAYISHTHLSHTTSHTSLSHTSLSATISRTHLCHTPSLTHNLSHTSLSHTIFHTHLCHTPSFTHIFVITHIFVNHHHHLPHTSLSHTSLSTTISHTQSLSHTMSQAWHLVTSTFVLRGRHGTYGTGLALVARLDGLPPVFQEARRHHHKSVVTPGREIEL